MFEKILYPTDFSDVSKKALDYVKQLKKVGTRKVIVLHVIDDREIKNVARYAGAYFSVDEVEKKREENAKEDIKAIEMELKKSGFDVEVRIEKGIPFRDILRVEDEEKVSATVIGSHGKTCIEEAFLGSVSEKVIRKSNIPVLVIRR